MTEKGKEDGSVAETLEEKVQELVTDAKEETGGSTSAAGVLDTLKGGFQTVTGGVGMVWQTLGEWKDQGTPLRKMFKTARLDIEDTAAKARERAACRQTKMRENMQKMAEERQARFKEFDKSGARSSRVMNRRRSLTVCPGSLLLLLLIIMAFCVLSASIMIGR
ncbi:expressed unknown protein [Ectocarpus siliculosus]|uniref:Uncharacterized protein n=1 Tax=Ectocarpus siliculosus TaxID=2880 RepID=D7FHX9_ECTSI|nr:expressed unknown protein [Ectocarpus siliculosus]|eukprot:CBJ48990.1 expressed unknown protein [Ectocarpus siliculosus]